MTDTVIAQPTTAARRAVDAAHDQLQTINVRMRELNARAERLRAAVDEEQAPRQEKRGLLATILRRGGERTSAESQRLSALDQRIASAKPRDDGDELQVIADLLAEQQRDAEGVHARMPALHAALAEAQFDAARAEIEGPAMRRFMTAAEEFRIAYGALVGLGVAHNSLRIMANERGAQCGNALGGDALSAIKIIRLPLPGFEVEELLRKYGPDAPIRGHNRLQLVLDATSPINRAAQEAIERWQQA